MKKHLFFLAILSVSILFTGCKDWLNVAPEDTRMTENFYQTPYQVQQALYGIYNGLLPLPGYYALFGDLRSDDIYATPNDEKVINYITIASYHSSTLTIPNVNAFWLDLYEISNRANIFLEKVDTVDFGKYDGIFDAKSVFIGEAHFLRAYAYLDLVRYFGNVPVVDHSVTADEALSIKQSTPQQVYDSLIIPDLKTAIRLLHDTVCDYQGKATAPGRATRSAAKALLARAYLTMEGFPLYNSEHHEEAIKLCREVIAYADASGRFWADNSMDKDGQIWPHIWFSENDNKYHIFEVQFACASGMGNTAIGNQLPISKDVALTNVTLASTNAYAAYGLLADMQSEGADSRFDATINNDAVYTPLGAQDNGRYITKFFEHKLKRARYGYSDIDGQIVDRTYFPLNYPLIRLEDVMLMLCELEGETGETRALINKIRHRAGLSDIESMGGYTWNELVRKERRCELAGEGIRFHDIVRWGEWQQRVVDKFNYHGKSNPSFLNYIPSVLPGKYYLPIPDTQMKVKAGLYQQNKDW